VDLERPSMGGEGSGGVEGQGSGEAKVLCFVIGGNWVKLGLTRLDELPITRRYFGVCL
jgi:hypothetical protein